MKPKVLAKGLAMLALTIGVGGASAQGTPVTKGELRLIVQRLDRVVRVVLDLPAANPRNPLPAAEAAKPATRFEVARELLRLADAARPKFRVSPRPAPIDEKLIDSRNPVEMRPVFVRLTRMGFVAPVGPLVAGPGPHLTTRELGDVLGYFLARMADVTHMPHPEWSPQLQGPDGFTPPRSSPRRDG